ncbi:MAG: hypothetical protein WC343_01580 [Bacilli bacterium]|jgi:hypothetical protein
MRLKLLSLMVIFAFLFALPVVAQDEPSRMGFGGVGYFAPSSPDIKYFAGMAIPLTEDGKAKSVTNFDFSIVKNGGQFSIAGQQLQYSIRTGIEYDLFSVKDWTLFGLGAPGVVTNGNNVSAMFEYGGGVHKWLNKKVGIAAIFTAETMEDFNTGGIMTNFAPRLAFTFKF